jgi:hypothetical protein
VLILLPFVTAIMMNLAGRDPQGLKIGIVNDELENLHECEKISSLRRQCDFQKISCLFVDRINKDF